MQLVELGSGLAPDTRLFSRVVDERGAELVQPMLPAQCEEIAAAPDVVEKRGCAGSGEVES